MNVINVVLECILPSFSKLSFEIERRYLCKVGLFEQLLVEEEKRSRPIGVIRVKMDFNLVIFEALRSYLLIREDVNSEWDGIYSWEESWLRSLDVSILVDLLAAGSHLKMKRLCHIIFYYSEFNNVSRLEDSTLTEDDKIKLDTLLLV